MGAGERSLTGRGIVGSRGQANAVTRASSHSSALIMNDNFRRHRDRKNVVRNFETQEALNSNDGLMGHWGG